MIRHPELGAGSRVLVACSGGADSVILLRGLLAVRGSEGLALAHVDHGLRTESDRDLVFVQKLGARLDLPCLSRALEMGPPEAGKSGESAAREQRYQALIAMAKEFRARALAMAHHADDQLETVMFRIIRGTGIAGLAGMAATRRLWWPDGPPLVRPLLQVPGDLIRQAAAEKDFTFCEDPTNRELVATRNRIRHELLPHLAERFGPRVFAALGTLMTEAGHLRAALGAGANKILDQAEEIRLGPLREIHLPLPGEPWEGEVLVEAARQALCRLHPERWVGPPPAFLTACRSLLNKPRQGAKALAPNLGMAVIHKKTLVVMPLPLPGAVPTMELSLPGRVEPLDGLVITADLPGPPPAPSTLTQNAPQRVWVDETQCPGPFTLRARCPGDRFRPLGATRDRNLKDFFNARGVPTWRRDLLPLICDGTGRIIWVAGVEISDTAKLTSATTSAISLGLSGPDGA